jgi:hypothetical protein
MNPSGGGNRSFDDPFADLLGLGSSATISPTQSNIPTNSTPQGIGLFDYTAQAPNQVTIRKGEIIKIVKLGAAGGWSEGSNSLGHTGFYPTDYVQVQKPQNDPFGNYDILSATSMASTTTPVATAAVAVAATQPLRAKVLFDYQAPGPQSMSLVKGQIIEVRTRGDRGGWSIGLTGAFPTDFVEFLPAASSAAASSDPFAGLSLETVVMTPQPNVSHTASSAHVTQTSLPSASQLPASTTSSTFIPPPPPKKASNTSAAPTPTASVSTTASASIQTTASTATPKSASESAPIQSAQGSSVPPPPAKLTQTPRDAPATSQPSVSPVATPSVVVPTASLAKSSASTTKAAEPAGFQRVERARVASTIENKEPLNPLDGTSFVLTPGNLSSPNAVWRQYLFMDLFADCHVRQMADLGNHIRSSTATSRVVVALNTLQKGLQYLDLATHPPTIDPDLLRSVQETLLNTVKGSLDLCSRIPARTAEPSKMFTFLATLMMRIAKMSVGDYLMFPLSWKNTTNHKSESEDFEHAIMIILRRINRDTTNDFSVTIVNTSVDEGLCYHAMKGNESDASILYNMSFTIPDVETARVSSSTFWYPSFSPPRC